MEKLAVYVDEIQEAKWRRWVSEAGAYINEANSFIFDSKHGFYGMGSCGGSRKMYDLTVILLFFWVWGVIGGSMPGYRNAIRFLRALVGEV